jgi:hypothetical protein
MRKQITRVGCVCAHCGASFSRYPSKVGRFCSVACNIFSRSRPVAERFWEKVDRNGPVPEHRPELGACWIWIAGLAVGYGQFTIHTGTPDKAHRISWEWAHGPIPDGQWVLHRCDNRACVRPDHLFLGTRDANIEDMVTTGRAIHGARNLGRLHPPPTRDQVSMIRMLHAGGRSMKSLSDSFSIPYATIRKIVLHDDQATR